MSGQNPTLEYGKRRGRRTAPWLIAAAAIVAGIGIWITRNRHEASIERATALRPIDQQLTQALIPSRMESPSPHSDTQPTGK